MALKNFSIREKSHTVVDRRWYGGENLAKFITITAVLLLSINNLRIHLRTKALDTNSEQYNHPFKSRDSDLFKRRSILPSKANNITKSIVEDPNIDWNDIIYKRNGKKWDNDPIVIESHKLLFFTIPKNSCTEFKMLFRRMMGFKDWKNSTISDRVHNPDANGLKYLGSYPQKLQHEFMTSPNWTRAIFLRDPKERALSAYLDKGFNKYKDVRGGYLKIHCCGPMKRNIINQRVFESEKKRLERKYPRCLPFFPFEQEMTADVFPFEVFVENFMKGCKDPHWAPQSRRMRDKTWKSINFVGYMDNLKRDGHALLRKIGAFEDFGRGGWGPANGAIFERNSAIHATSSGSKIDLYFKNPTVERAVLEFYRPDYQHPIMNMAKPASWERLMGNETENIMLSSGT